MTLFGATMVSQINYLFSFFAVIKINSSDIIILLFFTTGAFGFYIGTIMSALILYGVLIVYFVIQTQLLYPLTLAGYAWSSGNDPEYLTSPTFESYSSAYCALILFATLAILCCKKDLSIYMKVGAYGVIFIFMLIIFIIVTGIVAFTNTEFMVGPAIDDAESINWSEGLRTISMVNSNFSPLAGILGLGYFLHPASLPIVRSAAKPELVDRDVFRGYLYVFLSYIVIGVLGYIGFVGTDFTDYYIDMAGKASAG